MSHEQAVIEVRKNVAELLKDCPEVMKVSQLARALNLSPQAVRDKFRQTPAIGARVGTTIRLFKSKIIEHAEPIPATKPGKRKEAQP